MADPKKDDDAVQPNGLPRRWCEEKALGTPSMVPYTSLVMYSVDKAVGILVAFAIFKFVATASEVDDKLELLRSHDLGIVFIVPVLINALHYFAMFNILIYRSAAPVDPPNVAVMKVAGSNGMPYVLLEEEGDVGRFNRSQRAYGNILEYLPIVFLEGLLATFVLPLPGVVCVMLWVVSRMLYVTMYTAGAGGRAIPFALSQHLVAPAIEGIVILTAWRSI